MERIEIIKAELLVLLTKAVEILEKNYNTEDVELQNPAAVLSMSLEHVLWEISDLDEKNLKEK
jgi:hypothetical protein